MGRRAVWLLILLAAPLATVRAQVADGDWLALDSLYVARAPTPEQPVPAADPILVVPGSSHGLLFAPGVVEIQGDVPDDWGRLVAFRERHPAIERGIHERLEGGEYAFYRGLRLDRHTLDEVVIVCGATDRIEVNVAAVFRDDTVVREVISGQIGLVTFGRITFPGNDAGILLIEVVP